MHDWLLRWHTGVRGWRSIRMSGLQIRGMWPYWMDASSQGPVPNDIHAMDGLYLLTGAFPAPECL